MATISGCLSGSASAWKEPLKAQRTPIGNLPAPGALDLSGLNFPADNIAALTAVDIPGWKREAEDIGAYYAKFDTRLPAALKQRLEGLRERLG